MSDNTDFVVTGCTIYNTGTGAITLSGGDRKSLQLGRNKLANCKIYNYSRINRSSPPGIVISGVGNTVTHCEISDASSGAIGFSGNNHIISYNHIRKVATGFSDIGAVYTGRDPSSTGTIIEYNLFDSITNRPEYAVAAVYIDDGSGGMNVTGNIFYKCGNTVKKGFGAVHINGGHNNYFKNNYFIDCEKAFSNTLWDDAKWQQYLSGADIQKKIKKEVDIDAAPYTTQYPYLKTYTNPNATGERMNYISNTFLYDVTKFVPDKNSFTVNNTFNSPDGNEIASLKQKDFDLKQQPAALKAAKGWRPVPYNDIGIVK